MSVEDGYTFICFFFVFFIREFVNRPWSAICCVVPNIVALSNCQKVWYIYIIFNDPGCICIWKCNLFYIRMLSLQQSKRRIEIKTSFSSWTKNWSPTFWPWHLNWDAKSTNFQICATLHQTNKTFYPFMITTPQYIIFN